MKENLKYFLTNHPAILKLSDPDEEGLMQAIDEFFEILNEPCPICKNESVACVCLRDGGD